MFGDYNEHYAYVTEGFSRMKRVTDTAFTSQ